MGSAPCRPRARVEPTTTARENPATPSNGECPEIRRRSIAGVVSRAVEALRQIDAWDVPFAAAGVTRADATVATHGDAGRAVPLASVSKPVAALATLVAAEEGVVDLDEPAGPPGSTVRHLLAHTSGLPFEGAAPISRPGRRRIYSNEGFAVLGAHVARRAEMPFAAYVRGGRVRAARPRPRSRGASRRRHARLRSRTSSRSAASSSRRPSSPRETRAEMVAVQFPGLDGVLPDYGRFSPLDWGLGVELKGTKAGALVGRAHLAPHVRPLRRQRAPSSGSIRISASRVRALTTRRSATGPRPPGRCCPTRSCSRLGSQSAT